jgi:hypothetical protein
MLECYFSQFQIKKENIWIIIVTFLYRLSYLKSIHRELNFYWNIIFKGCGEIVLFVYFKVTNKCKIWNYWLIDWLIDWLIERLSLDVLHVVGTRSSPNICISNE